MKTHVIVTVLALVILPTAVLSFMASRAMKSQEILLDTRLASDGQDVLVDVAGRVREQLSDVQTDVVLKMSGDVSVDTAGRYVAMAADLKIAHMVITRVYVYDRAAGIVYPPRIDPPMESGLLAQSSEELLGSARTLQFQEKNFAAAIQAYEKAREKAGMTPQEDWEARLGIAQCYRKLGDRESAAGALQSSYETQTGSQEYRQARDSNGYLYELTALREITEIYEEMGRFVDAADSELALFSAYVAAYPGLVPIQRDSISRHIRQWTAKLLDRDKDRREEFQNSAALSEIQEEFERLTLLVREWDASREFSSVERDELAAVLSKAIEAGQVSGWVQTRDGVCSLSAVPGREGVYAGYRLSREGLMKLLESAALELARPKEFLVFAGTRLLGAAGEDVEPPGPDDALATLSPGPPFGGARLFTMPSNQEEIVAHRRLQQRLSLWSILLLVVGIGTGLVMLFVQVRQELYQARARSELLAGISHDLRTPVASVRMLSESLYFGNVKADDKRKTFLHTIVKECDRLTHMIDRALFFVRLGHDALVYNKAEADVGLVVLDAVETFRERVPEGRGDIDVDVEPGNYLANVDSDAIEQVILNLLDNALKYSPGKADIDVGLQKSNGNVQLSVSDHGAGMDSVQLRRIFKKYYRASATASSAKGVGLGLALCRHIVRAHGGRITVDSVEGSGSTFTVMLPLAES